MYVEGDVLAGIGPCVPHIEIEAKARVRGGRPLKWSRQTVCALTARY